MQVNLSDSEWKLMNHLWQSAPRTITELTAAVKSLRGMDRDVRDKLGRVKLALRYAYAGYYVDVTELDMNPFDGSLPEATRWTEREKN